MEVVVRNEKILAELEEVQVVLEDSRRALRARDSAKADLLVVMALKHIRPIVQELSREKLLDSLQDFERSCCDESLHDMVRDLVTQILIRR